MVKLVCVASLAAKAFYRNDSIHVARCRRDDFESYLLHFKCITGTVDRAHASKSQKRFDAVAPCYYCIGE